MSGRCPGTAQHRTSNSVCTVGGGEWFVMIGVGCASRARPEQPAVKDTSGIDVRWKGRISAGQAQRRARSPEMKSVI